MQKNRRPPHRASGFAYSKRVGLSLMAVAEMETKLEYQLRGYYG